MRKEFDISRFDKYREDNRREVKKANGGLPVSLWEITFANPGYVRTGKKQMRLGGESDPRNKSLMKMFNLINIGERAGSGVPNIFNVWNEEGFVEPEIEERFDPDRTILTLSFIKK